MADDLLAKYYLDKFLKMHCAHVYGRKILAKPIFVLTIIAAISDKVITENKFYWERNSVAKQFHELYQSLYVSFLPNDYLTPMYKPFFHLKNDGFWHLNVNDDNSMVKVASVNFLKTNLNYAYLDQELWGILQDHNYREYFQTQIIHKYIRPINE